MNIEINGIGYEIKRNKYEIDENYQIVDKSGLSHTTLSGDMISPK